MAETKKKKNRMAEQMACHGAEKGDAGAQKKVLSLERTCLMWEPQAWPWFKRLPTFRLPRNAPLCPLRPLKLAQDHRLKSGRRWKTRLRAAQPVGRMACARLYCDAACLKPESLPVKDTVSWRMMQSHRWLAAPKTRTRPKTGGVRTGGCTPSHRAFPRL